MKEFKIEINKKWCELANKLGNETKETPRQQYIEEFMEF